MPVYLGLLLYRNSPLWLWAKVSRDLSREAIKLAKVLQWPYRLILIHHSLKETTLVSSLLMSSDLNSSKRKVFLSGRLDQVMFMAAISTFSLSCVSLWFLFKFIKCTAFWNTFSRISVNLCAIIQSVWDQSSPKKSRQFKHRLLGQFSKSDFSK